MQDIKYKKQETRNKKQTITNNQTTNNQTNHSIHKKRQRIIGIFKEIGLSEKVRAQELSLEQWTEIASSSSLASLGTGLAMTGKDTIINN